MSCSLSIGGTKKPLRAYHVQFLGSSPERGWISSKRIFTYTGRSDYEEIITKMIAEAHAVNKKSKNKKAPKLEIPNRYMLYCYYNI